MRLRCRWAGGGTLSSYASTIGCVPSRKPVVSRGRPPWGGAATATAAAAAGDSSADGLAAPDLLSDGRLDGPLGGRGDRAAAAQGDASAAARAAAELAARAASARCCHSSTACLSSSVLSRIAACAPDRAAGRHSMTRARRVRMHAPRQSLLYAQG